MKSLEGQFKQASFVQQYRKLDKGMRSPGTRLLEQSGVLSNPPLSSAADLKILDNACGTGVITSLIKEQEAFKDVEVTATDFSDAMVEIVKERTKEEGWNNVQASVANAMDLKLPSDTFSHTITNFCFMMLPDPVKGIQEAIRVTKPGGTIGFTTWNTLGWYPSAKETAERVPGCPPQPHPTEMWKKTGDWHSAEYISNLLKSPPLSLEDVKVELFPCTMAVDRAQDHAYSELVLNILTLGWSEEQKKELTEPYRETLRQVLEEKYGKDVPVVMEYVAVVSTGRKPL
ncbi:S-adenosyl-L-methionine-dependent methyltransferase [Atractiella rhizophila]|nr:S-adenosyl-L-methionine-dependent methyltransferase [Atractiella rhizophila]